MKTKTRWLIAGTLASAFAVAGGLWAMYPENRAMVADLGREAGLIEKLPPQAETQGVFIVAGTPADRYPPAMAIEGCNANGEIVRLSLQTAIIADARRDEFLALPRIQGHEDKYLTLRRDTILENLQDAWQDEIGALSDLPDAAGLQAWLESRAGTLSTEHGLTVSFRINTATALNVRQATASHQQVCPAPQ